MCYLLANTDEKIKMTTITNSSNQKLFGILYDNNISY